VQTGSRSTPGPTVTSSVASAERAPSTSVAQIVVVSLPENVAVLYSQFESVSPAGTCFGAKVCSPGPPPSITKSSPSGSRHQGCRNTQTGPRPSERLVARSPSQIGAWFSEFGTTSIDTRTSMLSPAGPPTSMTTLSQRGAPSWGRASKCTPYQSGFTFETSTWSGGVTTRAVVAFWQRRRTVRVRSGRTRTDGSRQIGWPQDAPSHGASSAAIAGSAAAKPIATTIPAMIPDLFNAHPPSAYAEGECTLIPPCSRRSTDVPLETAQLILGFTSD
jgi:hypothetical protein